MAKREIYFVEVGCPDCGKNGKITYSENENPVYGRGCDKRVVEVSIGFKVNNKKIICVDCDTVILEP
tara:strand:+ start:870 stop:1070 length:201 start_codon:yes stop_codon:yes gene_type:complete